MRPYLGSYIGANLLFLIAVLAVFYWPLGPLPATFGPNAQDHPGAIGNVDWYMNIRSGNRPRALDREVLYHGIGHSMEYAREADIIIMAHSMGLFAFDWRIMQEFSKQHGVKIFNLSSGGDTSGEFLLQVALKNDLRPKIWLINADDYGGGSDFFSSSLSTVKGEAGDVLSYGSTRALLNIISKNMKWRFELLLRAVLPRFVTALIYPVKPIFNYRSVQNGNWHNDDWPGYATKHPGMTNVREPDCHASQQSIGAAERYLQRLGSTGVVLMVIPYSTMCRTRTQEITAALGLPFISIDWKDMTTFDDGQHMDAEGARIFTKTLLDELAQTRIFREAFPARK